MPNSISVILLVLLVGAAQQWHRDPLMVDAFAIVFSSSRWARVLTRPRSKVFSRFVPTTAIMMSDRATPDVAQSDEITSKMASILKQESVLKDRGCSNVFLLALDMERFAINFRGAQETALDEMLVGLRATIPAQWVALIKDISEVDASLQIQLKDNPTSAQLWSSILPTYATYATHANPQLSDSEHIKRYNNNRESKLLVSNPQLEQLAVTLQQLWAKPTAESQSQSQLQLQVIRELLDCGLIVAQLRPFETRNLNTIAMKLCLFLANNDAILRLSEESWDKIYSLSDAQFEYLCVELAYLSSSSSDSVKVVSLLRSCLKKYDIPIRADAASAAPVVVSSDIVAAFQAGYSDPWQNTNRFIDHIYECMTLHYANISIYKSPYTAIIQSSGTGKSKMLSEVAKQLPVIYVSLSPPQSSGFPKRTHSLAQVFEWSTANRLLDQNLPALRLCDIFIAGIRCFAANSFDPDAFHRTQDISNPTGSSGTWFATYRVSNIDSMNLADALTLLTNEASKLAANMSALPAVQGERTPCLLLVVDEARELLNLLELCSSLSKSDDTTSSFRLFRNALQLVAEAVQGTNLQLFAVLTDTSSRIGNFIPSADADPSSRAIPRQPKKLHKPFWLVQNSNIFYKSKVLADAHARSKLAAKPITTLTAIELLETHFTKPCMYRIGRPLWSSLDYVDCSQALAFAQSKLLGGGTIDPDKHVPSLAQSMAVLNVRIPMSVHAYGALSADLPAQHMRLITGISEDRALVFGEYGPEPVLAAASESIMHMYPAYGPAQLLQTLRKQIAAGMVDAGDIGERMVALTYLVARDRACRKLRVGHEKINVQENFPLITVEQLLQELHVNSVVSLRDNLRLKIAKIQEPQAANENGGPPTTAYRGIESDLNGLLHGTVSLNQFIEVSYTPSVSDLLCAYVLGVGIMCRRNQAGVDLIIPVMLPVSIKYSNQNTSMDASGQSPSRFRAVEDLTYNATKQRGVFPNSKLVVFADLTAADENRRGKCFGDINDMSEVWNSMTSIASKLLGGLSDDERWSLSERMSAILVQVKNSPDSYTADDANVTPERSVIRNVCGTWLDPKWAKAFIAVKHVLLSNTAKLEVMHTPSLLQHGLVLKGFNETEQPCMTNGLAAAMLQVVDTVVNPCITAGDGLDNRFVAATMIDFKHKISTTSGNNVDPFMASELLVERGSDQE